MIVRRAKTMHDIKEQIAVVWDALHAYREDLIPEGDPTYDEIWSDICTAMAVIQEELRVSEEVHHPDCPAVDGFGCRCNELGETA